MTFEPSLVNGVVTAIDGAGINGDSYAAAFALELSRQTLAFTSAIFEPIEVQSIFALESGLGSALEIIPLILYLVTLVLFW